MKDLTKLTIKELYQEMEELNRQLDLSLTMEDSEERAEIIMYNFERIEDEIKSRSEEELDAYIDENAPEEDDYPDVAPWDKDDTDPAGGRGLASHV